MFESLTIRRLYTEDNLDFGLLAEALVFYEKVNLIVTPSHLTSLIRVAGHDTLQELFDMGVLSLTYLENGVGVRTHNSGTTNEVHDYIVFDFAKHHLQNILPDLLKELTGKSGKARRMTERLKPYISPSSYSRSVGEAALEDIHNRDYVSRAISKVVHHLAPEYRLPDPFLFEVSTQEGNIKIKTNLDFTALNRVYHQHVSPEHSTVTIAYLLGFLQDARIDLEIASAASSELAISQLNSIIIDTRLEEAIKKRVKSEEHLNLFQEYVFDDAHAIREAVNRRERNMQDVASLVASAKQFRHWVAGQPENTDLRKAYLTEVTKLGWAEKLPIKALRWGLFTAADKVTSALAGPIAATVGGLGLSLLDSFVVDRVAQGWRPNHFVEGPLRDFVTPEGNS